MRLRDPLDLQQETTGNLLAIRRGIFGAPAYGAISPPTAPVPTGAEARHPKRVSSPVGAGCDRIGKRVDIAKPRRPMSGANGRSMEEVRKPCAVGSSPAGLSPAVSLLPKKTAAALCRVLSPGCHDAKKTAPEGRPMSPRRRCCLPWHSPSAGAESTGSRGGVDGPKIVVMVVEHGGGDGKAARGEGAISELIGAHALGWECGISGEER